MLDRFIQQAVMQVLQKRWDPTFSNHSYGFRPGRSAHQAVAQAQQYIAAGYGWVVDLDLATLYEVESRALIQAVKRNPERFPADFMFQLIEFEFQSLRSQIVILEKGRGRYPKHRPYEIET